MSDADCEQLPGLSPASRAAIFGATELEQRQDEARHPWLRHWAARHGAAPARWQAWRAAGRPAADRAALCIVGETEIVDAFRSALAKMPECPAWFIATRCMVVCGGITSLGEATSIPMLPTAPRAEWQLIRIHRADEAIAAHEMGHVYTIAAPEYRCRHTAARCEELQANAVGLTALEGEPALEAMLNEVFLHERAADKLSSLWLGIDMDTTSGYHGDLRRRGLAVDTARLVERAIKQGTSP